MATVPTRPPRRPGQRPEGKSAGLLVDVVRTLTTSPSPAQKELQKERLEKDYAITSQTIDRLLTVHQQDLTASLQSFRKVSAKIAMARERVKSVKNNLSSCKSLLQCKREELKQLWMESAEQKQVVTFLERIESLRIVPQSVYESVGKKRYLHAAEVLMIATENIEGTLTEIVGLNEIKENVRQKSQETYASILNEVDKQIYVKPSEELLYELRRLTSMRKAGGGVRTSTVDADNENASTSRLNLPGSVKSLSGVYLRAAEDDTPILQDDGFVYEDPNDPTPDSNPVQYLAILFEALGLMRRLPDAIEHLRTKMQRGLTKMIQHTTMFVYEHLASPDQIFGDNRLLAELLQLLFRQFKAVAILHGVVIKQVARVLTNSRKSNAAFECYTMDEVWKQMQTALQQLLNDYLDVRNSNIVVPAAAAALATSNLSFYFSKKRPTRPKKAAYFRFDSTTHAINVSAYAKEQKFRGKLEPTATQPNLLSSPDNPEMLFVCAPCAENVTVVFRPIMRFVVEIENKLTAPCELRLFLEEYTRDVYLPKIRSDTAQKLDSILRSSEAWEELVPATRVVEDVKMADTRAPPLLKSTYTTAAMCRMIESLMQSAPSFGEAFAELWLFVLGEYKRAAQGVYDSSTKSTKVDAGGVESERRKISAAWAVDEDISRLLKSLPNWTALAAAAAAAEQLTSTPYTPGPLAESADEIRRRNQRESEILMSNLGMQKKIEEWEVMVDDVNRLRQIANMQESIEWFVREMKATLKQIAPAMLGKLKESNNTPLEANRTSTSSLYVQFEKCLASLDEMAATCLLILHLEVRVHCFYYLLPIAKQPASAASHAQEVDDAVVRLNKDLVQLHEMFTTVLTSRKVKYMFEGLGHLISSIFINSSYHMAKINDGGKKRMCRNIFAIQQCLSTITATREQDLDAARKYFELLYKTPDEILNGIVENGAEYNEIEYHNLLALAIRSHAAFSGEQGALEQRVSRLREIMTERRKR